MVSNPLIVLFVSLIIFCNVAVVFAETRLSGKRLLCSEFNREYFANVTCSIKLKNRYTELYSDSYTLKPGVSLLNLKIKYLSFYKYRTEFKPTGVRFEEEICDNPNVSPFLQLHTFNILHQMYNKNKSIWNLTCPLTDTFKRDNMELSFNLIPSLIPTGEYRFDTGAYTTVKGKEIFLVKVQNFFECVEIFKKSVK